MDTRTKPIDSQQRIVLRIGGIEGYSILPPQFNQGIQGHVTRTAYMPARGLR
jgi:hypothetical protein